MLTRGRRSKSNQKESTDLLIAEFKFSVQSSVDSLYTTVVINYIFQCRNEWSLFSIRNRIQKSLKRSRVCITSIGKWISVKVRVHCQRWCLIIKTSVRMPCCNDRLYRSCKDLWCVFWSDYRSDVPDVVSLIRRIHELESSLIETKRKSQDLLSRRRILANRATSLLLSNHLQITQLIGE